MEAVKFVAEVAEEHAIEAGAEDVTSVEGDDQVQLAQYSDPWGIPSTKEDSI
jgi:hypothetical protein